MDNLETKKQLATIIDTTDQFIKLITVTNKIKQNDLKLLGDLLKVKKLLLDWLRRYE